MALNEVDLHVLLCRVAELSARVERLEALTLVERHGDTGAADELLVEVERDQWRDVERDNAPGDNVDDDAPDVAQE